MYLDVGTVGIDLERYGFEPPRRVAEGPLERARVGDGEPLLLELGHLDDHRHGPT
jgi:hypothetical protein